MCELNYVRLPSIYVTLRIFFFVNNLFMLGDSLLKEGGGAKKAILEVFLSTLYIYLYCKLDLFVVVVPVWTKIFFYSIYLLRTFFFAIWTFTGRKFCNIRLNLWCKVLILKTTTCDRYYANNNRSRHLSHKAAACCICITRRNSNVCVCKIPIL